jgi:hypothetical protein
LIGSELESLLKLYLSGYTPGGIKVLVYCAETLEIYKSFSSKKEACDYFNVTSNTITRHLDTELPTKQNGKLVYFFSKDIGEEIRDKIKNSAVQKFDSTGVEI